MAWEQTAKFWDERDAWAAGLRAKQANLVAAGKMQASRTLDRAADKWKSNGDRYLKRYGGVKKMTGREDARLLVDPRLDDLVRDILDSVAPELAKGFDIYLSAVMRDAFAAWPVYSGLSKSLLYLEYDQVSDGVFKARMGCAAPYTVFIQDGPAYKLIRQPGIEAAKYVAEVFVHGEPF